jgi:thiol:disulfide interchange protein DsbD
VNLAAAVLFTTFALNLFGVLPVRLPAEWLARLDTRARGAGGRRMLATLLMGGVFTLTSFACTAAFLGTLIVMSAAGDWRWPLAGMLAFSAVFAAPFFLLALLPAWIARLPRGSAWMGSVQVVMGLLELAATVKFLSNSARAWGWNALGRDQVLLAWIALALAAVVYFAACARSLRVAPAFSVLFLAGGAWLASGLPGRSLGALELLLPPDPRSAALGVVDCVALWWVNDYERARHAASRQRRLLLVDNAAPGTRMLEPAILVDPEVMRELSRFVLVRLYAGGAGKPRLLVETPAGEPIAALAGPVDDSRALAAFLRRAHAGSAR